MWSMYCIVTYLRSVLYLKHGLACGLHNLLASSYDFHALCETGG